MGDLGIRKCEEGVSDGGKSVGEVFKWRSSTSGFRSITLSVRRATGKLAKINFFGKVWSCCKLGGSTYTLAKECKINKVGCTGLKSLC